MNPKSVAFAALAFAGLALAGPDASDQHFEYPNCHPKTCVMRAVEA